MINRALTDQIKELIGCDNCYIYGAKNSAVSLYEMIDTGELNINGFLVTETKDNPESVSGLKVIGAASLENKQACIIVPHTGVHRDSIVQYLNENGYTNVHQVAEIIRKYAIREAAELTEEYRIKAEAQERAEKEGRDSVADQQFVSELQKMLSAGKADFGGAIAYQSLEKIGLKGNRPTLYRSYAYHIRDYVTSDMKVLDIGCNTGCFDITIAGYVKSITGVEYDSSLVKVGNRIKDYLNIDNICYCNSDFVEWAGGCKDSFDAIFSFAIHHWINVSVDEYFSIVDRLLLTGGYLWLESHSENDDMYDGIIERMKSAWSIVREDVIHDSAGGKRRFVVVRKG